MAANTYTSISDIVNEVSMMIGDDSYLTGSKNFQLRNLALQGLKELTFDTLQEIKSVQLAVAANGTITLPDDYIKYTKIGILGSDDKVHTLGKQDRLNLVSGATSTEATDIDDDPAYFYGIGGRYGVGGGTNHNGYYRVNKEDNTISFSSDAIGKNIILEYISNGLHDGITPGVNRIVEMTCSAGSAVTDGDLIFLRFISTAGSEGSFIFVLNTDNDTGTPTNLAAQNAKVFILINPSGTGTQTAASIRDQINTMSPYHSATSSGNVVTITYNQIVNWSGSESNTGPNGSGTPGDFTFNVVQAGSAQAGTASFQVPQVAEEALKSYIYWKYIQRKRGVPFGEKQLAKRDYYNEKRLANARLKSFTKEEAMQSSRKGYKQSPKI